jgi:hypothetical protein
MMGRAHPRVDSMKTQLRHFGPAPRQIEVEWEK